jgi:hypothetical protein
VFVTKAGTPVTTARLLRMIQRTGVAVIAFPMHERPNQAPQMVRPLRSGSSVGDLDPPFDPEPNGNAPLMVQGREQSYSRPKLLSM